MSTVGAAFLVAVLIAVVVGGIEFDDELASEEPGILMREEGPDG